MNRSIIDVENAILKIFENMSGVIRFVESITLNKSATIVNYNDKNLKIELRKKAIAFKNNNIGILDKLIVFSKLNKRLKIILKINSRN